MATKDMKAELEILFDRVPRKSEVKSKASLFVAAFSLCMEVNGIC